MRVQPPPADDVAARRRDDHAAAAREQRPGQQERRADPPRELLVELGLLDLGGVDADVVRPGPLDLRAEIREQLDHRLDVADARDVRELDRLVREQAGGENREGAVLVARGADPAVQRNRTLDHERLHERVGDGGRHGG